MILYLLSIKGIKLKCFVFIWIYLFNPLQTLQRYSSLLFNISSNSIFSRSSSASQFDIPSTRHSALIRSTTASLIGCSKPSPSPRSNPSLRKRKILASWRLYAWCASLCSWILYSSGHRNCRSKNECWLAIKEVPFRCTTKPDIPWNCRMALPQTYYQPDK